MKIVINTCYGGFSISQKAAEFMAKRGNKLAKAELKRYKESDDKRWYGYGYVHSFPDGYKRDDIDLVAVVESLGSDANGNMSELKVVNIPDRTNWEIEDDDGRESVHEIHRSWN